MARKEWADYFDSHGIQYAFFSAINAAALQQARRDALLAPNDEVDKSGAAPGEGIAMEETEDLENTVNKFAESRDEELSPESESSDNETAPSSDDSDDEFPTVEREDEDPRTRVLSVLELEELFTSAAPDLNGMPLRMMRYET